MPLSAQLTSGSPPGGAAASTPTNGFPGSGVARKLSGAPKGYTCKGRDAPGTVTKSRPHDGSCIRLKPPTMFDWGPIGGTVG